MHHSSIKVEHIEELLGRKPNTAVVIGSWDGGDEYRFKTAWPGCKVHGVEASPTAFTRALEVVPHGITMTNCAIAAYDGQIPFYGTDNHNGEWCSGSVLKHTDKFSSDTGVSSRSPIVVNCMRFDTFCQSNRLHDVDFLQMDTEGYVGDIISGFGDERPKVLFIEILPQRWYDGGDSVDSVCAKLALLGYENIDNNGVDWLFVRRT
jgi:FkbM family methyltransferase